jgi:hypothetical protein
MPLIVCLSNTFIPVILTQRYYALRLCSHIQDPYFENRYFETLAKLELKHVGVQQEADYGVSSQENVVDSLEYIAIDSIVTK